jgi:hypothetical protein
MHTHAYACMHTHAYACMHTHAFMDTLIRSHAYTRSRIHAFTHTRIHAGNAYTQHACIRIHACLRTCKRARIYTIHSGERGRPCANIRRRGGSSSLLAQGRQRAQPQICTHKRNADRSVISLPSTRSQTRAHRHILEFAEWCVHWRARGTTVS